MEWKRVKTVLAVLLLLVSLAACASTENDKSDTKFSYGGNFRARGISSHGVSPATP